MCSFSCTPPRDAPGCYVGSLGLGNEGGSTLFRVPSRLVNNCIYSCFYKMPDRLRMDPILVSSALRRVTEIHWASFDCSDDFISNYFASGTVRGYRAGKIAPQKRQKVDNVFVVPVMVSGMDVHCLPGVNRKTIFEVARDYRRYHRTTDDDAR